MALMDRSATWPWQGDKPVHIPRPDIVPAGFLLPGDPARVDMAAAVLEDFVIVGQNREFRMGIGRHRGMTIGVCSTGIGGASTEIVGVELAALGVRAFIRTGGMGAMAADLELGDFVIAEAAIANSGCARPYAPGNANVAADADIVRYLDESRLVRGLRGRRGITATADGYYRAQGRPDHRDGNATPAILDGFAARGADGMEMEAEIVLAIGAALGVKAGAVMAVHAHRSKDSWMEDYDETQRNVVRIGADALVRALGQD